MALQYYLGLLVAYLGIIIGMVISHFTKEEMDIGRKYFLLLQYSIVSLVLCLILITYQSHYMLVIILPICLFVVLLFLNILPWIVYMAWSLVGYWAFSESQIFFLVCFLICLYGISAASVLYPKKDYRGLGLTVLFLIIGYLLPIIST